MDAVRMLVHDHEVLTSQVEHVSALIYGLVGKEFSPEPLRDELVQQIESLKDQLLEHFGFEEEAAFPYLLSAMPEAAERLRSLAQAHDRIARCLVEVAELALLTTRATLGPQTGAIAAAFERFVNHYRMHVREESDVLASMAEGLSIEQRREFSDLAKTLV
ncbi:MAG TPA: hemerythrin domain-containing protein [Polyangiaceae bacterium]